MKRVSLKLNPGQQISLSNALDRIEVRIVEIERIWPALTSEQKIFTIEHSPLLSRLLALRDRLEAIR